jgi:hypothetical protein
MAPHGKLLAILQFRDERRQMAIDQRAPGSLCISESGIPTCVSWFRENTLRLDGYVPFSCPDRDVHEV